MKKIGLSLLLMLAVMSAWADVYQDPVTKVNYEYTPGVNQASVIKSADATGDITILSKFSVDGNEYTVTSIGNRAFRKCQIESIVIPTTIATLGYHVFSGCSFKNVTFEEPSSLATIAMCAFDSCGITELVIPSSVTTIEEFGVFGCKNLKSVFIPKSVTQMKYDELGYAPPFSGCNNLESVVVEEGNPVYDSRNNCNAIIETATGKLVRGTMNTVIPEGVKMIGTQAFEGIDQLASISIPSTVTALGLDCFRESGLTTITIPETITTFGEYAVGDYGQSAFMDCNNLREAFVASPEVSYGMFTNCKQLEKVELAATVTKIADRAFHGCSNLQSITIPAGVKSIGARAFSGCHSLNTVVSLIEEPFAIPDNAFNALPTSATLIVPKGAKAKYEAAEGWKQFKYIIEEGYYFYVHRAGDFRLTEIMTRLWRENPDNNEGISTVVEVDKSFIEGLGNVQKLATIPTESMTLDIGERASNPEKKEFDCGTYKAEFDLNTIWVIIPEQWHNVCLPLNMRTTLDKKMAFPIVFSLSIEGVNYAVFSYLPDFSGNTVVYRPYHHFITEDGTCFKGDKEASTTTFAGRLDAWTVKDFAIPEQVENGGRTYVVDKIEMEALVAWNALQSVTIPNTIKSSFTFKDCNSLQKVTSLIEDPSGISGTFTGKKDDAVLYVPQGTVEKYKEVEGWKEFKHILEIGSVLPGDANGDGVVDVADVVAIVNYILEKPGDSFVFEAADINHDGTIDVSDVVSTVNIILTGDK